MCVWFLAVKSHVCYVDGCQHMFQILMLVLTGWAHWWCLGRSCAGSAKPQTSILTFPLGQYCFPQCIQEKHFSLQASQHGAVGCNQASSRSPPLFSFPLLSSHSFGAELSVVYVQPCFGFTETFKGVNFQLWQQHLHPGCRCRSLLNLPSLLVRAPEGFLRA